MSRRLAEMTEETIDSGEKSAAKNVQAAGFSEELKKQLEARIEEGAFRNQNQRAMAESEMPVGFHHGPIIFSLSLRIVFRRQRHSRSSDSTTMDGLGIAPRLDSKNAGRRS